MDLQERRVGNTVVLDLSGRLTLGDESTRLKDKINSVLQEGRCCAVRKLTRNVPYPQTR